MGNQYGDLIESEQVEWASEQTYCFTSIDFCVYIYIYSVSKNLLYYVFPLLWTITENKVAMWLDLSTCVKFPDAFFQLLLLIMSKIVAEI